MRFFSFPFHIFLFISYTIIGDFMDCLNNLSPCELVTLANIISVSIAQNLSSDELASLAGFFTILGDSLAVLAVSPNSCDKKPSC